MVFANSEYNDELMNNSHWESGDRNGDGDFGTGDLIAAFRDGGCERGTHAARAQVPESRALVLVSTGCFLVACRSRYLRGSLRSWTAAPTNLGGFSRTDYADTDHKAASRSQ